MEGPGYYGVWYRKTSHEQDAMGSGRSTKHSEASGPGFIVTLGLGKNYKTPRALFCYSPNLKVLVSPGTGNRIPDNAIIAGEERRKPLYIARTFYEVCYSFQSLAGVSLAHGYLRF